MKIAIAKEKRPGEARVAASPDTVKKLIALGGEVLVERGAGEAANFADAAYAEAGAKIVANSADLLPQADIVLKVQAPLRQGEGEDEVSLLKPGAVLIASLSALQNRPLIEDLAKKRVTAFALELLPRITRAQSMDILSSQSNLAGYKAVLDAVSAYGRVVPMMMTAAGTVPPARFLILGAGVAGLQAIATAKRLGGVVYAFDVRPAVKEQVQSLGGKFIEIDGAADAETKGGYAKEMDEDYKRKQAEKIHQTLKTTDIAITTALIPGKPAPLLITEEMVKDMRAGSVIVDLAVEAGGNCALSEAGRVVVKQGVTIIGHANVPSRLAADASVLFAKNVLNFLSLLIDKTNKTVAIDFKDEIVKASCVCHDGAVTHPAFSQTQGGTP